MYILIYINLNLFVKPRDFNFFRKADSDENSPDSNQPSFLLPFKRAIGSDHPIYQLNERINWSVIEEDFKKLGLKKYKKSGSVTVNLSVYFEDKSQAGDSSLTCAQGKNVENVTAARTAEE